MNNVVVVVVVDKVESVALNQFTKDFLKIFLGKAENANDFILSENKKTYSKYE